MSVTSANPSSLPRLRDRAAVLVVIVVVVVYFPATQIQDVLTHLIALSAVLVCGSAVNAVSPRRPRTTA
ncbi:hypothetical protein [Streptomyces prasinopilosus]|uniref:hypothetical protein n=1 Tax=Streptomyces prasinopilosus TaxID=67344 RepID=UPI0006EBCDF3|nr:hypothetical protein [Streptomyces prasinopilosus]